jgi:hypothetical protein
MVTTLLGIAAGATIWARSSSYWKLFREGISFLRADAHLQEFFQAGEIEPREVYVSRSHPYHPLFMTLP